MKVILDEAMNDGAFGLSSMLEMPPGSPTTTDDIVEVCGVVTRQSGIYSTHNRNKSTGSFEAVKEATEIGERACVSVDVIPLKIADQMYSRHGTHAAYQPAAPQNITGWKPLPRNV